MKKRLHFDIQPQPDDVTCGPTCLHAVYRYYGDPVPLTDVVDSVPQIKGGGTLAVLLGCDALTRGYTATLYTYNLLAFDPTWFVPERQDLVAKLRAQIKVRRSPRLRIACEAYVRFLELGGQVEMVDLTASLLRRYLDRDQPIIAGLSSTWLYRAMRERIHSTIDDDLHGVPGGPLHRDFGLRPSGANRSGGRPLPTQPARPRQFVQHRH